MVPQRLLLAVMAGLISWALNIQPARSQTATPTPTRTPTNTPKPDLNAYRHYCPDIPVMDGKIDTWEYGAPILDGFDSANASYIKPILPGGQIPDVSYSLYMTWTNTDIYFAADCHADHGLDGGLQNDHPTDLSKNDTVMVFVDPNLSRDASAQYDDFAFQFCGGGNVSKSKLSFGDNTWLNLGNAIEAGISVGNGLTGETGYVFEAKISLNDLGMVGSEKFDDWDDPDPLQNGPIWEVDDTNVASGDPDVPDDESPAVVAGGIVPGRGARGELKVWGSTGSYTMMHTKDLRTPFDQDGEATIFLAPGDCWRGIGITAVDGEAVSALFATWKGVPAYWLILSSVSRAGGIVAGLNITRPQNITVAYANYTGNAQSPIVVAANSSALIGTYAMAIDIQNGQWYRLRWIKQGAQIKAKAWREGSPEPAAWQITVNDPPPNTPGRVDALRDLWWNAGGQTLQTWTQLALAGGTLAGGFPAYVALADEILAFGAFAPKEGRSWGIDFVVADNGSEIQWYSPGPGGVHQQRPSSWGKINFHRFFDFDCDRVADLVEDGTPFVAFGKTNRYLHDSDGDGIPDGREDANRNGRRDAGETDPRDTDTDNDKLEDAFEIIPELYYNIFRPLYPTDSVDPLNANRPFTEYLKTIGPDHDALPILIEQTQFNIQNPDVDGDGFADGYDYLRGYLDHGTTQGYWNNPNAPKPRLGDVDGDGFSSNLDGLIIISFAIGLVGPDRPYGLNIDWNYSDVDRDGQISNLDALVIQNRFLSLLPYLPLDLFLPH